MSVKNYFTDSAGSSFHGLDNGKTTPGPVFKRKQAEDWRKYPFKTRFYFSTFWPWWLVFHQDQVIRRVNSLIHQLNGPSGYQLTRRPFRINWFINQLAMYVFSQAVRCSPLHILFGRCLVLWSHDTNLNDALKLAKSILIPIDVLNALWPCPGKSFRRHSLNPQRYWHTFLNSDTTKMWFPASTTRRCLYFNQYRAPFPP